MGNFVLENLSVHTNLARAIALPRGRIPLHAVPTAVGLEHLTAQNYSWDGLKRGATPFVIVQHTLRGEGRLDFNGRQTALTPGDTMLVRVPHAHRYFLPRGGEWQFFFLVLSGREVVYLADEILGTVGPVLRLEAAGVQQLSNVWQKLMDAPVLNPGTASSSAYEAMMILFEHAVAAAPQDEDWLAPIFSFVSGHLGKALPVEKLADVANMSRAHFVRQFTRAAGVSPSEYVFKRRMEKAANLLEVSRDSIAEVAAQCGFANANYFAKAFRRAFDVSPSEFRESGMYTKT